MKYFKVQMKVENDPEIAAFNRYADQRESSMVKNVVNVTDCRLWKSGNAQRKGLLN